MTREEFEKKIKKRQLVDRLDMILSVSREKDVLDVGCVGEDHDFNSQTWVHGAVSRVCKTLSGTDTNIHGMNLLQQQGYHAETFEHLQSSGRQFDIILILDVIEHVENPQQLLHNYGELLRDGGVIVISTPNSNRARNFFTLLLTNDYSVNVNHVFWLCPKTAYELARRSGLGVVDFFWAHEPYFSERIKLKKKLICWTVDFLVKFRPSFADTFLLLLKKQT